MDLAAVVEDVRMAVAPRPDVASTWSSTPSSPAKYRRDSRLLLHGGTLFELRERHRTTFIHEAGTNGLKLLAALFRRPLVNVNYVVRVVDVTFPTANPS
ncbi:MAG TPA: hypothetical protein VGO80_15890 [Solirubrobacteraceae bacterium]|nr:hypothetical protein [Solirubrobacteraceae bacterium]